MIRDERRPPHTARSSLRVVENTDPRIIGITKTEGIHSEGKGSKVGWHAQWMRLILYGCYCWWVYSIRESDRRVERAFLQFQHRPNLPLLSVPSRRVVDRVICILFDTVKRRTTTITKMWFFIDTGGKTFSFFDFFVF
jgi:hypothetical protein